MPSNLLVATQFTDLALKHEWPKITELPADEIDTLFNIVTAAGFNPKKIIPGKLVGHYRDQDGSATEGTYPINHLCPFKVVGQEDGDDYFATGWLDCALRCAVYGSAGKSESREQVIAAIKKEIEQSAPLPPIQLTREGDLLGECPPRLQSSSLEYFVQHSRDSDTLNTCLGVHMLCTGYMDRHHATPTHHAIVCRKCFLRIPFPKKTTTYGALRNYFLVNYF